MLHRKAKWIKCDSRARLRRELGLCFGAQVVDILATGLRFQINTATTMQEHVSHGQIWKKPVGQTR